MGRMNEYWNQESLIDNSRFQLSGSPLIDNYVWKIYDAIQPLAGPGGGHIRYFRDGLGISMFEEMIDDAIRDSLRTK